MSDKKGVSSHVSPSIVRVPVTEFRNGLDVRDRAQLGARIQEHAPVHPERFHFGQDSLTADDSRYRQTRLGDPI